VDNEIKDLSEKLMELVKKFKIEYGLVKILSSKI